MSNLQNLASASNLLNTQVPHILVVEDESEISELMTIHLVRAGFSVTVAKNFDEALQNLRASQSRFNCLLVDWMLPQEKSGIDLISYLKTSNDESLKKIPVLMITARAEPNDIITGLEAGADDYITKPFDPSVLMARVKALLRRGQIINRVEPSKSVFEAEKIIIDDLSVNLATYEVHVSGELIELTPSEFKLLTALTENRGRVLTRDKLIESVQGGGVSVVGRTVDTHVFGLRKKLKTSGELIETVRGVGYRVKT